MRYHFVASKTRSIHFGTCSTWQAVQTAGSELLFALIYSCPVLVGEECILVVEKVDKSTKES